MQRNLLFVASLLVFAAGSTRCGSEDSDCAPTNQGVEICDGVDNDCDGTIDEDAADTVSWYPDRDEDGFGADAPAINSCLRPLGHVAVAGDCDDAEPTRNPIAPDICNGRDDDCDDLIDEDVGPTSTTFYGDGDGDGFGDPDVAISACEPPSGAFVATGDDCNDADPAVNPAAVEICNDVDDDCDAIIDGGCNADGDAYCDHFATVVGTPAVCPEGGGDCDDARGDISPGHLEICDPVDHDCSGDPGLLAHGEIEALAARRASGFGASAGFDGQRLGLVWLEDHGMDRRARFALLRGMMLAAGPFDLSPPGVEAVRVNATWDEVGSFVAGWIEADPGALQLRILVQAVDERGPIGSALDLGPVPVYSRVLELVPAAGGRVAVFFERETEAGVRTHVAVCDLAGQAVVATRELPSDVNTYSMSIVRGPAQLELAWPHFDSDATPRGGYMYMSLRDTDGSIVRAPTRHAISEVDTSRHRLLRSAEETWLVYFDGRIRAVELSGASPTGPSYELAADPNYVPFHVTSSPEGPSLLYESTESNSYVLRHFDNAWAPLGEVDTGRVWLSLSGASPSFFHAPEGSGRWYVVPSSVGEVGFPEILQLRISTYQPLLSVTPVLGETRVGPYSRNHPVATFVDPAEDTIHVLQTSPVDPVRLEQYGWGPGGATTPTEVPPFSGCRPLARASDGTLYCAGARPTHGELCYSPPSRPLTYMLTMSTLAPGAESWSTVDLGEVIGGWNEATRYCSAPFLIHAELTDEGIVFVARFEAATYAAGNEFRLQLHRWDGDELTTEIVTSAPLDWVNAVTAPGPLWGWIADQRSVDGEQSVYVTRFDRATGALDAASELLVATSEPDVYPSVVAAAWSEDRLQVVVSTSYGGTGEQRAELYFVWPGDELTVEGPFTVYHGVLPAQGHATGGRAQWRWVASGMPVGLLVTVFDDAGDVLDQRVLGPAGQVVPIDAIDTATGPRWLLHNGGLFGQSPVCE